MKALKLVVCSLLGAATLNAAVATTAQTNQPNE